MKVLTIIVGVLTLILLVLMLVSVCMDIHNSWKIRKLRHNVEEKCKKVGEMREPQLHIVHFIHGDIPTTKTAEPTTEEQPQESNEKKE